MEEDSAEEEAEEAVVQVKRSSQKKEHKAWIISVDMGYGHQRAAYPLKDIAYERIITANNDKIISLKDHRLWEQSREFYEFISRLKQIPILGKLSFDIYDQFQKISPFFPFRDLSKPNFSVLRLKALIKRGLCQSIVDYTSKKDIPVITTHFIPAMAFNYNKRPVYCVVTDTDINRIWVPDKPDETTISYLAPCRHVVERLKQYGIPEDKIIKTGFPLPKENIGKNQEIIKKDLLYRLYNLDPNKIFFRKFQATIKEKINRNFSINKKYFNHILTLTYTIGGAGAQKGIGEKIILSLKEKILENKIRLNISVGTKIDLKIYFEKIVSDLGLKDKVKIIFAFDKRTYFETLNKELRATDILWTKPSEMSFYTALGIPIIIAPPIGAHEHYNKEWLEHKGSGFIQKEPEYCSHWLFYWLEDGRLADSAFQGFVDAPVMGTYNIEKIVFNRQI